MVSGFTTVITTLFLKETYGPFLLSQMAKRLRRDTGNDAYTASLGPGISLRDKIYNAAVRPFRMLFLVSICAVMATYSSL